MKRIWFAVAVLLLAGCGVQPSGVTDGFGAPTGLAPGVTLYFADAHHELRPQLRRTGQLGTISDAMSLLLSGPGDSGMDTEIAPGATTRVGVNTFPGLIRLRVPFTINDVTPLGIDQLVCTALGVYVQGGGARATTVQVTFTESTPASDQRRTCPLIR